MMAQYFVKFLLTVAMLAPVSCSQSHKKQSYSQPTLAVTPKQRSSDCFSYNPDGVGGNIGDDNIPYSADDSISYLNYKIIKKVRKSRIESSDYYADIEYAVLSKGEKVIATFDADPGQNSEIRFSLLPLLGKNSRQLIIEQTSNRFWRYWIVSLQPMYEVIYDSGEYDAIYWMKTADFDKDGNLEIIQNLGAFWFFSVPNNVFASFNNINSPRPEIIFKYNPTRHKYLPANQDFKEVALKDLDERIGNARKINQEEEHCFVAVIDVVLRYIYAGMEKEGWEFYEREYRATDNEKLALEIKKALKHNGIYRAIYHGRGDT